VPPSSSPASDDLLAGERRLWRRGISRIAGVDEAGLGPLAGPAVAAAVILPPGLRIAGAADSKKLTAAARTRLDAEIRAQALAWGIGLATVEEIDCANIYQAGLRAMRRALENLAVPPEYVLLDARTLPDLPWPQEAFIRGDASHHCIACASILAKVHRDGIMREYDRLYPEYGFARHKGYPTPEHRRAIARLGPSPIHRRSFRLLPEEQSLFPAP
jgi:ribonuclease HII